MKRSGTGSFQDFYRLLQTVHQIPLVDVLLGYTDIHGDLLPINNDDNYHKALSSATPLLRVIIQKRGKQELKKGAGSLLPGKGEEPSPAVPLAQGWSRVLQPPCWQTGAEVAVLGGPGPCRGRGTRAGSPWQPFPVARGTRPTLANKANPCHSPL